MSDVAKLAGVSLPTVSRVINGGHWVRAETAHRVHQAIEQLSYRPNATARALAHGGADIIGVLSHASGGFGSDSIVAALEQAARESGYTTMLTTLPRFGAATVQQSVDRMVESGAAAVVLTANWSEDAAAFAPLTCSVPVVVGDRMEGSRFPVVGFDEVTASQSLVEHLLGLGHATVHHIGGAAGWSGSQQREEGWRRALLARGTPVPSVVDGDWTSGRGFEAATELLDLGGVTAVFAANDQTALGLIAGLHARGIRVPQDVSVAGFDALADSAFYLPALTSIRNDYHEYARRVVGTVLSNINLGSVYGPAALAGVGSVDLVRAEVVWRASIGPPSR